jgi:FKBP-type peptidyl-prolyl cis-trans isomerase
MKKTIALSAVFCSFLFTACNADTKPAAAAAPTTEEQKTAYALGLLISDSLQGFELKPDELALVQKGIADGTSHAKVTIDPKEYIPKIQALQQTRLSAAGLAFLEKAAKEPGATKTTSGMVVKQTKEGTGAKPVPSDQVKVNYEGRLIDGKVFDSSFQRGEPAVFGLTDVIPCWTEGLQTMKVGGKAQLTCPAGLAYGPNGHPPAIPPQATLVFDVELLDIVKPQPAPAPAAKPDASKKK